MARNHRIAGGELDLVVQDQRGIWVVIEVRGRAKAQFGAAYRFPEAKARQLRRLTDLLARREKRRIRIELVEVTGTLPRGWWRHWALAYFPERFGLRLRCFPLSG